MSNSASDYNGFGFAVAHEYIKENFNEQAKQEVRQGNLYTGGKAHYRLCSCKSTISLAIGIEEIKAVFFKTTYLKADLQLHKW